ncbi:MAG: hypothetical protein E7Z96_02555 [Actinomycetaceae bacterium]|nr:hypothetical protein [Actinomycetaceae bacterium]
MLWPRKKPERDQGREAVPASARVCPRPPAHVEVELTVSGGRRISLMLDLVTAETMARNLTHACNTVLEHAYMQDQASADGGDVS